MLSKVVTKRIHSLSLLSVLLVTVGVSPTLNYDPINLVKQIFLAGLSFAAVGLILSNRKNLHFSDWSLYPIYLFIISIFIPVIFADTPLEQQIWGNFGRNNGLLTFLSSAFLILSIAMCRLEGFTNKFINLTIGINCFLVSYCLIQIANLDPIVWSLQAPFATLGNVNFLSAVLGIQSVILVARILFAPNYRKHVGWMVLLLVANLYVMVTTDSIQGPVILLIGSATLILLFLYCNRKKLILLIFTLCLGVGAYFGFLGLANSGPLKSVLYQSSNIFRIDYMLAALRTFQKNWLTGAGLDSFDGWYRSERGFVSAYRTGPNRTTNSAHNVYLDIAAGGGLFMILSWLAIISVTVLISIRYLKKLKTVDADFFAIFGAFVAFLFQAAISINQIGVSIWGWILIGILLSHRFKSKDIDLTSQEREESSKAFRSKNKSVKRELLQPSALLVSLSLFFIGVGLALPPMTADIKYRSVINSGDFNKVVSSVKTLGMTSFHISSIVDLARKNNFVQQAVEVDTFLVSKYKREFFGWNVRITFEQLPYAEREKAYNRVKELDPFFACADIDPQSQIRRWFDSLPVSKKYELLRWWEIVPFNDTGVPQGAARLIESLEQEINARIEKFCV